MGTTTPRVRYEVTRHIADIVLDRPPVNALDFGLAEDLLHALRQAGRDPDVRAVVLSSHSETMFCAGLDLKAAQTWSSPEVKQFLNKLYLELYDVQCQLGKPSIAAVRGMARGGGMTVAISCDMIVAGERANFAYSEINVGLIPAIHLVRLPRLIGRHRAFDLLFNGDAFGAQDAYELGLVNRVVPDAEVMSTAREAADKLAQKSPSVMKIARDAFMQANDLGDHESISNVIDAFVQAHETEDAREGLRAFAEKRPPQWGTHGGSDWDQHV
ncbi:MAG: enoyl-CoA hydratase/isomerase family protein [Candidatus Tectomicrobia bacterium]|nr:enoyl-CoA hydratase/isomerase family protein [Candidatus Tectomicrobia bacterium]